MQLDCGCVQSCCGICEIAAAAGKWRLDHENAAAWPPPNLNVLKGKKHQRARDADDGEPMLWYWQMAGSRWNLDSGEFDAAKKAWRRLAATTEERAAKLLVQQQRRQAATKEEREAETAKRYARDAALREREEEEETARREQEARERRQLRREEKRAKRQKQEERKLEERARRWREIRPVLRRCGLERLFSEAEWLRDDDVITSLYEPQPSKADRGMLGAVTAYLAAVETSGAAAVEMLATLPVHANTPPQDDVESCGGDESSSDWDSGVEYVSETYDASRASEEKSTAPTVLLPPGVQAIARLDLSVDEARALKRAVVLTRFEDFVAAAMATVDNLQLSDTATDGLLSIEQLFDVLYDTWGHDYLDMAERLGAASAAAQSIDGQQQLHQVLSVSVLRGAADGLLRVAEAHARMRAVLMQVLTSHSRSISQGRAQMWTLLKHCCMASDSHFEQVTWFLGRLEFAMQGRLWAVGDGMPPQALVAMCELVGHSKHRAGTLVRKLLQHSVVLREPVRLLFDAHWQGYVRRAWSYRDEAKLSSKADYLTRLDRHFRAVCSALLPDVIQLAATLRSEPLCRWLLLALRQVTGDSAKLQQLSRACPVLVEVGCGQLLRCWTCLPRVDNIMCASRNGSKAGCAWDDFVERQGVPVQRASWYTRGPREAPGSVPSLRRLSLDGVRTKLMGDLGLQMADVANGLFKDLPPDERSLCADRRVDALMSERLWEACPHKTTCCGSAVYAEDNPARTCCVEWQLKCHQPHSRQEVPCPQDAIAYLLQHVDHQLASSTKPLAVPQPESYSSEESSDDDGHDVCGSGGSLGAHEKHKERCDRRRARRCWAPFAFP